MALHVTGSRLLVKKVETQAVSAGGIVIPEAAQEASQEFTVIALGPDVPRDSGVSNGSRVVVGKYAGSPIKLNGEELIVIDIYDVLVILELNDEVYGSLIVRDFAAGDVELGEPS